VAFRVFIYIDRFSLNNKQLGQKSKENCAKDWIQVLQLFLFVVQIYNYARVQYAEYVHQKCEQ
jgi:hypothetical protein